MYNNIDYKIYKVTAIHPSQIWRDVINETDDFIESIMQK